MRSPAQQKADKRRTKKLRRIPLDFNHEDMQDQGRLKQLEKQPNMTAYIKGLIDRDIEIEKFSKDCEKMH